jgi:hypothetical protein
LDAYLTTLGEKHSLVTLSRIDAALAELELGQAADALPDLVDARVRLDAIDRYREQFVLVDLGRSRALTTLGRPAEALGILHGMNTLPLQGADAARRDLALEMQAEMGRALMASGHVDSGRAELAQALSNMQQPGPLLGN